MPVGWGRLFIPLGLQKRERFSLRSVPFTGTPRSSQFYSKIAKTCGYCSKPFSGEDRPTFDHIRPASAKGSRKLQNGILACKPCNGMRQNTPLIAFLKGEEGSYHYSDNGDNLALDRLSTKESGVSVTKRQNSFSNYLKPLIARRVKINPFSRETWFEQALDNLLFPIWKTGAKPQKPKVLEGLYQQRVKEFLEIVTKADPSFWTGKPFEIFVQESFAQLPHAKTAFTKAIKRLRRDLNTQTRFQGQAVVFYRKGKLPLQIS